MKFYASVDQIGNNLCVREIVDGKPNDFKVPYNPTLWVKSNDPNSDWQSIKGTKLEPIQPGNIQETREFMKSYENVAGFEIHGDIQNQYKWINEEYPDQVEFDYDQLIIDTIDIETSSEEGFPNIETANEEVLAITIFRNGKAHVFGFGDYVPHKDNVVYYKADDERGLLLDFLNFWKQNAYPHILTGWNTRFFDIPYLYNRIKRLFGEQKAKELSPWKKINHRRVSLMGREHEVQDLFGIGSLDFLDIYKKFTFVTRESYRLNFIAHVELKEKKLDYSEYGSLHNLYKSDYQKFIEYNIQDVELVSKLEDKLQLLNLCVIMAYFSKVNFDDVYSQVRMWDVISYNTLYKKKIAIPPRQASEKDEKYAGAYVKEPVPGMYKYVASFDLNSLYPHLIMQFNISPETFLEHPPDELANISPTVDSLLDRSIDTSACKRHNVSLAANGECFSNEYRGFLPAVMQEMYTDRKFYKGEMLKAQGELDKIKNEPSTPENEAEIARLTKVISKNSNFEQVKKVSLNSAYGAIGNQWFRYYDTRMAEAVTLSGQLAAKWVEKTLNDYFNKLFNTDVDYIIASDTDSVYINFEPLIDKVKPDDPIEFLIKVCDTKIEPLIDKSYQELADYVNAFEQKMEMARETISDLAIWTGKKHYILNICVGEYGKLSKPKLKAKGIETVKSSTPEVVRDWLTECIRHIMSGGSNEELISMVERIERDFKTHSPETVAFPRSVNNISAHRRTSTGHYSKGAPMHVKGTLLYNSLLEELELTKKYELIREGEKIYYLHLKQPNTVQSTVVAFPQILPPEFELDRFIDYDMQFEKSFLSPLRGILDVIDWKLEHVDTLEDIFG